MKPDDFENQLRRTPMREIPAEWRAGIIGETNPASSRAAGLRWDKSSGQKEKQRSPRSSWWRDLLWPSPLAWGALACIWAGIILSNVDFVGGASKEQPMATISAEALLGRLAQQRSLSEGRGMF